MTDDLTGYRRHIAALNPPVGGPTYRWWIGDAVVGWLTAAGMERLQQARGLFTEAPGGLRLNPELADEASRSAALAGLIDLLAAEGRINPPMGEPYPVTAGERHRALCCIDRTAAGFFGVRAFGQHLNGYVRDGDQLLMWLGRRARDRLVYPGRLDNLVAGGLPHGIGLADNLVKECFEEAGMPESLALQARAVSLISYNALGARGCKPDVLYCYDLELPPDFVPENTDGEVEEFQLLPIEQVARIVRETDEFKLNCNLVVMDFMLRHGYLDPASPGYMDIAHGLRPAPGASFEAACGHPDKGRSE